MHKQFYLQYKSDKKVCGDQDHTYGNASTVKTAKGYIAKAKRELVDENPRNFRVYDCWTPDGEPAKIVYTEE
ncbi:MAG: hypothetical protein RR490_00420 [Niameybacter sp.]